MAGIVNGIKGAWLFVTEKIWRVRLSKLNRREGILVKQVRVLALAVKGFNQDRCIIKATALTFYSVFSIVPILALIFAIAKGFGLEQSLELQLLGAYPEYNDILSKAFVYANSMLSNAKGGVIAGFGIVLLLWSVLKLLVSIEEIFNDIWRVKLGRTWIRKVTDYLTVMLVSPFLLIIAGGVTVALQTEIGNIHLLSSISSIMFSLLAYTLVAAVFTFLFMVMPNTKIKFKSAAVAAVISTVLFELVQWAYLKFQIGANQLNAIYGGFAALPLFFIWVQYSWYVVLFGAEIAYANQHADHYELEDEINSVSERYQKVIALMIANIVTKEFYNGEKALTGHQIASKLDLPYKLVDTILREFLEVGLFVELKNEMNDTVFQPGVTESKLTVRYVIDKLDRNGVNELPIQESPEYLQMQKTMDDFDNYLDNELGNTLVRDLVK